MHSTQHLRAAVGFEFASQNGNPGQFATPIVRGGLGVILDEFAPAYEAGWRDALLHRPLGESANGAYHFNLGSAQDLKSDPVAGSIIEATPAFLDEFHRRFPDARIIAYFGSSQEPAMARMVAEQRISEFLARYTEAFGAYLDRPFVDLCFDFSGSLGVGNPHGTMITAIADMLSMGDRTVFVEPQPRTWSQTALRPSIMLERWWHRHAEKSRPVVRWWNGHALPNDKTGFAGFFGGDVHAFIADCQRYGCGVAININELKQAGMFAPPPYIAELRAKLLSQSSTKAELVR